MYSHDLSCSFMQCSEMSLKSHLLLPKLDRFEGVLYSLMNRYYNVCFEINNENNNQVSSGDVCEVERKETFSTGTFGMLIREKEQEQDDLKNEKILHQKFKKETKDDNKCSEEDKVTNLCMFLLGAIDRNYSAESIDSELFCLRY